jgi:ATP-binding cassette, subfamily B, bacterial
VKNNIKNDNDNNSKRSLLAPLQLILHTLSYFYKEAFRYQPMYFLIIVASIILNALHPFINILLPKLIIDELLGNRDLKRLITIIAIIVFSNMICNMLKDIIRETLGKYDDNFDRYFKIRISNKTMQMDFEHTEDPEALEQASRAETGMEWYSGGIAGLTFCFVNIISSILTLTGVIVVLATGSPILLGVILLTVLIRTLINAKNNAINVKHFKGLVALNRAFGYIFWELSDFRFGKEIRLYGAADMMLKKADYHNDETTNKWKAQSMEQLPYGETDVFISVVNDGITYLYLGYLAIKRIITIGDFNMLTASAATFANSLQSIIWNIQEIHKKSTFMQEYIKFMNYESVLYKGTKKIEKSDQYVFEFINVSFHYPRSKEYVLRNINLRISGDEHLSVVGLNGAGKTTFIKLLCRLYDVTEGEIRLNGINIKEYDYAEYMKLFAVVFQDYRLFAFSIKENINLMDDNKDNGLSNKEVLELCELCGLSDKINSLGNGVDTILYKQFDESGIEPSGGEAQKIAIARALYKNAPVVILDEPTAALDPIAEYEIYNHFDRLVGGKIAVYISHRLSSCKFCDRIAVFSKDTIAEYGTHDELLKIPNGVYAEMFAAQAQYYI